MHSETNGAAAYAESEHIQEFIRLGKVEMCELPISQAAHRYLKDEFALRNSNTIVDWGKVIGAVLRWNSVSDEQIYTWASNSIAGECDHGLLLFAENQPCLVGPFQFMIRNFDELVWKAPGNRILFGVNKDESGKVGFTKGIIEFDGKDNLYATINA